MTKQQQEQVKNLLAQGYASTTDGTFSISLSGGMFFDIPTYAITIFMNFHPHVISESSLERISDVCRAVGVLYLIRIVHGVLVVRIS